MKLPVKSRLKIVKNSMSTRNRVLNRVGISVRAGTSSTMATTKATSVTLPRVMSYLSIWTRSCAWIIICCQKCSCSLATSRKRVSITSSSSYGNELSNRWLMALSTLDVLGCHNFLFLNRFCGTKKKAFGSTTISSTPSNVRSIMLPIWHRSGLDAGTHQTTPSIQSQLAYWVI